MKPLSKGFKTPGRKKDTTPATETTTQTASARSVTARNGGTASGKPVTIEAKIDVGFGNTLYLRGEGQGLSWNQGVPLTCVDSSTWKWSGEVKDAVKCKLLLNDSVWAQGEDIVAAPGQKVEISPAF